MQQRPPKQPAPQRSRVQVARACTYSSVHTSGGRELRRVRVASRVGLVDVLWHGFHRPPSRRAEQRGQPQWPSRLHLCGGGATTPVETARWRRVGTRVDWSCSRRCLRSKLCTLGLPFLGNACQSLCTSRLYGGTGRFPSVHLQSTKVVSAQILYLPNVGRSTYECAEAARVT